MEKIDKVVEKVDGFKEQAKQNVYYILIASISLVVLIFFPMLGSSFGAGFNLPSTAAGWCIYVMTKVIVTALNLTIYYSFLEQGHMNAKKSPKYQEAIKIVGRVKNDAYIPRSPKKYKADVYGKKGATIAITTVLGLFAFSSAIISFDWASLITYAMAIVSCIIFGVINMLKAEQYWIIEFYDYAKRVEYYKEHPEEYAKMLAEKEAKKHPKKKINEELKDDNNKQCGIQEPTGTSVEESGGHPRDKGIESSTSGSGGEDCR